MIATALVAAVGDAQTFRRARDMGAWLGMLPRQRTTGGKPRLLGTSKRGNTYLRTLFIHGARVVLPTLSKSETSLGLWLRNMLSRSHRNVVVVDLANKLVRIAWATLRHGSVFAPAKVPIEIAIKSAITMLTIHKHTCDLECEMTA